MVLKKNLLGGVRDVVLNIFAVTTRLSTFLIAMYVRLWDNPFQGGI
jgi:hypothetical protein